MKPILSFLIASLAASIAFADTISLSLNNDSGVYQKGETIIVTANSVTNAPTDGKKSTTLLSLKVLKNNDEVLLEKELTVLDNENIIYETTLDEPSSLIIEATFGDAKDTIGAIVAPDQLQPGSPRPHDFDTFWKAKKQAIAALPLEVDLQPIDLEASDAGYAAFDVEINAPGPRPARAIFVKPANAVPKSLPIVLNLHAAGVKGDWCRAHLWEAVANAKKGNGALSFDLNAHGMLNHEDETYYEELENGPLKNYWDHGNTSREDYYFLNMYARMLRSIEFLTQQPEWDGQRILVIGESQGGGQALAAAGLDPRVTAAVVTVPAMCDFGGPLANRKGGWPQPIDWNRDNPKVVETAPYFDAAHLLAGSQATIVVEIGLIDETCPSTSIYAAVNQAAKDAIIYPVTYRTHGWPEGDDLAEWETSVRSAKNTFIDDYLK
ncbi:Acetyl xylan esterase superfamily [Verrucomicrobiia bacterium DG1235]|nr:Acetyl xylan esterase superfamily [Verrucomicrobiae bacterium DG1235]